MESVVRNVRDLNQNDRSTLERVVGQHLRENQQLVIQVMTVDAPAPAGHNGAASGQLPDWCNVYEGLTDAEIADLEQVILTRADLSRSSD